MAALTLSLKISLEGGRVTKTIQFDPQITVFDACKIIRDKFGDAVQGQPTEYGLFLSDDGNKQGVWLESGRNLNYYLLRNHDVLEYRRKLRTLRVRMLDGALKTILVDDSQTVSQLMVVICTKIGITNHEEYGLVREEIDQQNENLPDNKSNFGTLTMRRKVAEKERDAKMESLRKKLKTDDEINWVDTGKTLREQGIDEAETVLLKRKFFYSDQNIDSRDPVQLNLLYVQARDAILDGTHPVTQDKACEFAGIQAHIQFGPYNELKHKPGFLDLKEFLPQSYVRAKGIEKKIFAEQRRHIELPEIDAKVLYTKTARELPTYGVTFFLVKEKMHGRNKLVPRLLGVTKDSVLRLDEHSKEILKTWPLTTVRRWGASPSTFTLDFGDYADQYYSVQTTEAEQIVQLIAGYIDIILKKKQSKDHFGIEGDEGSTMVEDSVNPSKATIFQHETNRMEKINTESLAMPGIMRGSDGERPYTQVDSQGVQYGAIVGQVNVAHPPSTVQEARITSVHLSEPQRALLGYISVVQEAIIKAEEELQTKAPLPDLGKDLHSIQWKETTLETAKQVVTTHIGTVNAATAQVVQATHADDVDHEAVSSALTQIVQSIPEVTREVRKIAALMEDDHSGDKLLDTARKLCKALSDLLKAAEPESKEPRQSLLSAAGRVGETSGEVLSTIGEESPENRDLHDMLLALAKAVANTTAALVLRAKSIAAECDDDDLRNRVIAAATECALATSQLVACAKVVAPTISNPACREQLEAAAREVGKAVSNLVDVCNQATNNPNLRGDLLSAAKEVSSTLVGLLEHIKLSGRERAKELVEEENPVENVLVATDMLVSTTDPKEMIQQAKLVGLATTELIRSIKGEAESHDDAEIQKRLMAAAKQLADATTRLVEAARLCATSPNDTNNRESLRSAAENLREITTTKANTPAYKRRVINRLEYCAKQAASAATQCISASQNAVQYSEDIQTKEQLLQDCQSTAEAIPRMINSVKSTLSMPDDSHAQLSLIEASEQFIEPSSHMCSSARALQPTVMNATQSQQLSKAALHLSQSVAELASAAAKAREVCGGQELESALEAIGNLRNVLDDTRQAAHSNQLRPLPGESAESTSQQLSNAAKGVSIAMTQLLSAVTQNQRLYAGAAGRDTALALGELTKSVRGVVATGGNPGIIDCADDTVISSMRLVEEAQRSLQNMGDIGSLTEAARDVSSALSRTIECLPGQREVDESLRNVSELSEIITLNEYPATDKSFSQLQKELQVAADNLSQAGNNVAQAYDSPAYLATTSQAFSFAYKDLLTVTLEMTGQTQDTTVRTNIINGLRGVSATSCSHLSTAKSIAADPQQPNAKNQLASSARTVTDSINYLVDVCVSGAPGQKECDSAIRTIESLRSMLDNPNEPLTDQGYFDCVETATEKSRNLGYAISDMTTNAKNSQHIEFGHSVNGVSESIRGLIESAAQAAYLIGVSHPTSTSGRPGIIDQSQLNRAYQGIRQNCEIVSSPNSTKQQKISALTVIAKHTSYLCSMCRQASMATSNPVAKNEFIESAKQVASTTSELVQEIKALDDNSMSAQVRCVNPLLSSVNSLCQYASSAEFVSLLAKIGPEGRRAQEPIIQSGRGVLDGVIEMVRAAKSLAVSPEDPAMWHQLASHSTPVSESVKRLLDSIRDKAPGQAQCDEVLKTLTVCSRDLDGAAMSIGMHGLPKRTDNTLDGFTGQTFNCSAELIDKLEPIRAVAKRNAENLGHAVGEVARYVMPLTSNAIGTASHLIHSNQQSAIIDQMKSVVESAHEMIQVVKEAGGNPRATHLHSKIDDTVDNTREAIQDLTTTVEKLSSESGMVTNLMEQISRSIARMSDKRQSLLGTSLSDNFVDYQTRMVQHAKEIARCANEINAKAPMDPSKLPQLSVDMTHHYTQLAQDSVGASYTTNSPDVAIRIKNTVQDLGRSIGNLIQYSATLRPGDHNGLQDVSKSSRDVSEKVSQVLAALQAGSRGTQACINAASTVSGIIGDLDTTIMFATAGTLHSEGEASFADHRENILKTARDLVEDTKVLVAGAGGTQDQLAAAAQNAVSTILQLADAVKRGACSLGSTQSESQVMVINAVKDVASAMGELINSTKAASGKPINDPAMMDMKESARVMVLNVSSLLKTVKAVEDEHTRGTRAMEATVEAISQELKLMQSPYGPGTQPCTPEDLIRVTKNVTLATAKAVAAGTSNLQSDILAAANLGRGAISDMMSVCRSVAWCCAETPDLRQRTLDAGANVAVAYRDLLDGVLKKCSADERMHLSRRVAKYVTDLVAMAQLLKGSDWVDPEDPTVIAENELLGAAASIDAAAKKLASLRPRRNDVKEADENMKFDEMILEAAKGIMAASSALVRAANAAQRELIEQGKVSRTPLTSSDDGQWSEGLISAARLVAAATHSLVEAAQNLVQGVGTEEMLISSAKQVAASTAQLLIACKVKSDPNSETGRRLQSAGNAVIKSTDNLVRAAQQAIDMEEEHILKINTSMVDGMAQEINARSEVLKMEKQLEEARNRLVAIRQAKYRQRVAQGFTTDDSDTEGGYQSSLYGGNQSPVDRNMYSSRQDYSSDHSTSYGQQRAPQYNANNRQAFNTTPPVPPPPSTYNRPQPPQVPPRPPHVLTSNAIPRPYQSFGQQDSDNRQQHSSLISNSYGQNGQSMSGEKDREAIRRNVEACVQDLHEKTYGPSGVLPMSTFKSGYRNETTQNGSKSVDDAANKNYEGYTNRYETKSFDSQNEPNSTTNISKDFSTMTITSDGGTVVLDDGDSTQRSSQLTQRVMERKTVTTKTEQHSERKTQQHSYRLD